MTGDDFGIAPEVDAAIVRAAGQGALHRASLLAAGASAISACASARELPALRVGIHLALVDVAPVLPPSQVPTLVTREGRFPRSYRHFLMRFMAGTIRLDEVEREWRAQIDRAVRQGIRPAHLNSHQHLHVLPPLFAIARRLAKAFGINEVRVPYEPSSWRVGRVGWIRTLSIELLGRLAREAAGEEGRLCAGLFEAGRLNEEAWLQKLERIESDSDVEFVAHPGTSNTALGKRLGLAYDWEGELQGVLSDRVAGALRQHGFTPDVE